MNRDQEQNKRQMVDKGVRARNVLEDPTLQGVFNDLRGQTMTEWLESAPDDTRVREDCWHRVRVLDDTTRQLKIIADSGRKAENDLIKEYSKRE